eukprot:5669571-Pyramimonas_sp.AAC.1
MCFWYQVVLTDECDESGMASIPPTDVQEALCSMKLAVSVLCVACEHQGIMSWYVDVYPKIFARREVEQLTVWEGLQEAGETVYIPSGWMHGVLNLQATVAVTENFVPKNRCAQEYS